MSGLDAVQRIDVRPAVKGDVRELAHTLGRAFFDDPVMMWMLPDPGQRAKGLATMFATMGRHQFLPLSGVDFATDATHIAAAALWAPPDRWRSSRMTELRMLPGFFRAFGSQRKRGQQVAKLMKANHPEEPAWYLAVIGSDPTYRGQGYGRALLADRLERIDAEHAPAYLESSNPDNVPYYERFGFEVTAEFELPDDGPSMWAMWRQPR
jgi:ribosomal protein S18 acetylase RimI-like enzyme